VGRSGAGAVICPSTEANLGDGLPDLPHWLQADVPLAVASDGPVCRHWAEELRSLEYGQRLQLQRRNVAAAPAQAPERGRRRGSSDAAVLGGGPAAGLPLWSLRTGARADLVVLDAHTPVCWACPPATRSTPWYLAATARQCAMCTWLGAR